MIKTLLTFISLFNFCDWVIALFIAGTMSRIQVREYRPVEGTTLFEMVRHNRRSLLAVGLSIFFLGFALVRFAEFANLIFYRESFVAVLKLVPENYTTASTIISGCKTMTLLFCWFAVSLERRDRDGGLSGNVVRNKLWGLFEKLR